MTPTALPLPTLTHALPRRDLATSVRALVVAALDLALPSRCVGCAGPAGPLCPGCWSGLVAPPRIRWPTPVPAGLPTPWSVTEFAGAARAAIVTYKDRDMVALRRPLGQLLGVATLAAIRSVGPLPVASGWALVPVPSSARSRRTRGRDVGTELAAQAAAALRGAGVEAAVVPLLRHRRSVADSAGLPAAARAANVAGAVQADQRAAALLRGRPVVVVDDIVTTGQTLAECARAMAMVGVRPAAAATVAATSKQVRSG